MKKRIALLLTLLISVSSQAQPNNTEVLVQTFANIKTFQAGFIQTLYDANKKLIQKSKGLVYIQKPSKFRWDYRKPFQQLILSNSKDLWIYDVEMEQATVKPVDDVLDSAPAVLLGSNKPINQTFNLTDRGTREGLAWVELQPKEKESDFNRIIVGLDKGKVKIMELSDNFGQTTQIQFNQVKTNMDLKPSLFDFIPPKGVDIIGR